MGRGPAAAGRRDALYGRSGKPTPTDDGHDRFSVVGHDRGSYYALRLALDYPETVERLAVLDSLPICEHLDRLDVRFANAWWHWFFFAQPAIPERVINADPDSWYRDDPELMGEENYEEWRRAMRDPGVVRGMLEDYRAGLSVDARDERADRAAGRKLQQPVLALWSTHDDLQQLYGDPGRDLALLGSRCDGTRR